MAGVAQAASLTYDEYTDDLKNGLQVAYSFKSTRADFGTMSVGGDFSSVTAQETCTSTMWCTSMNGSGSYNTGAFTVSFDLLEFTGVAETDILDLHTSDAGGDNQALKVRFDNNNAFHVLNVGQFAGTSTTTGDITLGSISSLIPSTITLTFDGSTVTGYVNGKAKGSFVLENVTSPALTGFQFGKDLASGHTSTSREYDNVAFWNRALTENEVAVLAATPAVPEPATATLSLLALAGLAARRRRAL